MRLTRFHCRGFRCLRDIDLEPGPGINFIRGRNAQGKTSILEAILFAATSKSHRTTVESDLLQRGTDDFHVRLECQRDDRPLTLESHWWQGQKRVRINGIPQTRLSELLGKVRLVFFAPEDITLVKGGAGGRRRFLDMELAQLSPTYLAALQQYRQVLRQRNELLRHHRPDAGLLDVWDEQLAKQGERLIEERMSFLDELGPLATHAHEHIAAGEQLTVSYAPDTPPGALSDTLHEKRDTDLRRRMTTHGPHRDDIAVHISGEPARSHASQGQQKSAALAMRLAELELIHRRTGDYPILLLDEVLAELDADRSVHLFDAIPSAVQCLVTTTQLEHTLHLEGRNIDNVLIEEGALIDPAGS